MVISWHLKWGLWLFEWSQNLGIHFFLRTTQNSKFLVWHPPPPFFYLKNNNSFFSATIFSCSSLIDPLHTHAPCLIYEIHSFLIYSAIAKWRKPTAHEPLYWKEKDWKQNLPFASVALRNSNKRNIQPAELSSYFTTQDFFFHHSATHLMSFIFVLYIYAIVVAALQPQSC